jgi:hypothetical protein
MAQQCYRLEDDVQIPADVIPPSTRALLDELLRRGYAIREERYDEKYFGNVLIDLERNKTLIRIVLDRSQWFVRVASTTGEEWFPPVVWHAFLTSSIPPLETDLLDTAQAQLLLGDLPRIETATRDFNEQTLAGLLAWRSRRAEAHKALPPTDWQ